MLCMGRRLEKNYSSCEPCFMGLFKPYFVRYIHWKYHRPLRPYISDESYSKSDQNTHAKQVRQNRFFPNGAHTPFGKNNFVTQVFLAYLGYNLSEIYIANIRLIYRTNCTLCRTKKHTQNKSDIFDLYIRQIRRLEKNYTFCDPSFCSLFRPQFVRYIWGAD